MGSNLAEQEFPVECLASLVTFLAMHGLDIEDMVVIDFFNAIHQKGRNSQTVAVLSLATPR